jgi:hypothetical protein
MQLPDFLIIGESKCGTTSMYDNLIQHQRIDPTRGNSTEQLIDADVPLGMKELRFFDKNYNFGWDWYKDCFNDSRLFNRITGEASPTYFARELAMKRIFSVMPDIKIIVMLRNPVDRLVSHFDHKNSIDTMWNIKYPSIEDYWLKVEEPDYYLIERGMYSRNLKRLFNATKNVHVVISEEFFANSQEETDKVFDFLKVGHQKVNCRHSRKGTQKTKSTSYSIYKDMVELYQPYITETEEILGRETNWQFNF